MRAIVLFFCGVGLSASYLCANENAKKTDASTAAVSKITTSEKSLPRKKIANKSSALVKAEEPVSFQKPVSSHKLACPQNKKAAPASLEKPVNSQSEEHAQQPGAPVVDLAWPQPQVAVPWWRNFCSTVTVKNSAWHRPMHLYVSSNASEMQQLMTAHAVLRWNALFANHVIRYRGVSTAHTATTNSLADHLEHHSAKNWTFANEDGASVIYFLPPGSLVPGGLDGGWGGLATFSVRGHNYDPRDKRYDSLQIIEADMFIGPAVSSLPWYRQVALVMHEIGHALGLAHISISGNIMSYDKEAAVLNLLRPVLMSALLSKGTYDRSVDIVPPSEILDWIHKDTQLSWFAFDSIVPQEQEKTALMCLYDFQTWGK